MKKFYEIALMQHVTGSVENDYETVCFECESGYSYMECKKKAKEFSMYIGKVNVPHTGYVFNGREANKELYIQGLDAGLAAVKIVCYTEDDTTSYEPLYYEYYKDGKVESKVRFDD